MSTQHRLSASWTILAKYHYVWLCCMTKGFSSAWLFLGLVFWLHNSVPYLGHLVPLQFSFFPPSPQYGVFCHQSAFMLPACSPHYIATDFMPSSSMGVLSICHVINHLLGNEKLLWAVHPVFLFHCILQTWILAAKCLVQTRKPILFYD